MILANCGVVFDKEKHVYHLGDKQLWGITGMLSSQLFPEKYDFVPQKVLQRAASRGSIIHEACDHYDKTGEVRRIEVRWYENVLKENNIKVLSSEYIVTDFEHFASPIDKVVEMNNEIHLIDIKTTSALDYEYLSWQLSVYKYLFGLVNPDVKIGGLGAIWIRDGATYHEVQEKPVDAIKSLLEAEKNGQRYVRNIELQKCDKEALAYLSALTAIIQQIGDLEKQRKEYDTRIARLFEQTGMDHWETDYFVISKGRDHVRKSFDSKALEADNPQLYQKYVKEVPVKGAIKTKLK